MFQIVFENDSLTFVCRSDEKISLKEHSQSYIKWTWQGKNVGTVFNDSIELLSIKESNKSGDDMRERFEPTVFCKNFHVLV